MSFNCYFFIKAQKYLVGLFFFFCRCYKVLTTGVLVTAIGTVIITIALPDWQDAATVATLELTGLTFRLCTYGTEVKSETFKLIAIFIVPSLLNFLNDSHLDPTALLYIKNIFN